jgi:hypothetical protein
LCGLDVIYGRNGKSWYNAHLFLGVTWEEVNAVCPGGPCNGFLNGHDMTDWTWATGAEVQALLDFYGTIDPYQECPAVYSFFMDGWLETNSSYPIVTTFRLAGWTSGASASGFFVSPNSAPCEYGILTDLFGFPSNMGAFFYYTPNPP